MPDRNGSSLSKLITKIAGAICMVAGLATVWLPIPTGLILMVIGLTLLIASSPTIAAWARLLRRRNEGLNDKLNRATPYLPMQMQRILSKTRPNKKRANASKRDAGKPKRSDYGVRGRRQPEAS